MYAFPDLSHLRLFGTLFVKVDSALLIYLHVNSATRLHFASIVHEKYFGAEGPLSDQLLYCFHEGKHRTYIPVIFQNASFSTP
jgi:hypothetical protein